MKNSLSMFALAAFAFGPLALTSCKSEQEKVREESLEKRADSLESQAKATEKAGENQAEATKKAAEREADALKKAAEDAREQK